MATKKSEDIMPGASVPEEAYDPWKDEREITLPRNPSNEQNFLFVAVNDRRYQVPRTGTPVRVPYPVYAALMNSTELRDYAAKRKAELMNRT